MRTTLLTLTSLVLIILFSSLTYADVQSSGRNEIGSIRLEGNKIVENIPKDLKINIDFEDNMFKGKKGFKSAATGRQVTEKPRLVDYVEIIEKDGIKFINIKPIDTNYKINPIPIVEGLNIKISRQGLDGIRVKVDMPLIEKEDILAKDKSGIMLVIPEEKLTNMLNQLKENRKDIYDGFEKYQESYKKLYGKEKRYKEGDALRKVRSFDIVHLSDNKEILFIRMSRWLTGKKFSLYSVGEELKEAQQEEPQPPPSEQPPTKPNQDETRDIQYGKTIEPSDLPVTKTEPIRERSVTNPKEPTKRISRTKPEEPKPREIKIGKEPPKTDQIQPRLVETQIFPSKEKKELSLQEDVNSADINQQILYDFVVDLAKNSDIKGTINIITGESGFTFSITPEQNTRLPTTDLDRIGLIEKNEKQPVTITLSNEGLKNKEQIEELLGKIRDALNSYRTDYISIEPIEIGTFIPDTRMREDIKSKGISLGDKQKDSNTGSVQETSEQKQDRTTAPAEERESESEEDYNTIEYRKADLLKTAKYFDFSGKLYEDSIAPIKGSTSTGSLIAKYLNNEDYFYQKSRINIFDFKAVIPRNGEIIFMPYELYDSLLRETAIRIRAGENRVNYLGETSYSPDRTNEKLQEEFLEIINELKTTRGSGENEFYYVGYKELQPD